MVPAVTDRAPTCEEHRRDGSPRQHPGRLDRRPVILVGFVVGGIGAGHRQLADVLGRRRRSVLVGPIVGKVMQKMGLGAEPAATESRQLSGVDRDRPLRPRTADAPQPLAAGQGPLLLAGGVLAASVLLHLRDPHRSGSWGYCPWLMLTGTYCPGCGGLRAVNDLAHGDVARRRVEQPAVRGLAPGRGRAVGLRPMRGPLAGRRTAGQRPPGGHAVRRCSAWSRSCSAVVRNLSVAAWLAP